MKIIIRKLLFYIFNIIENIFMYMYVCSNSVPLASGLDQQWAQSKPRSLGRMFADQKRKGA